jgi:signal transduction histidine kinase
VVRYRHAQYDAPLFVMSTATGELALRDTTVCVDIGVRLRRDVAEEIVAIAVPSTGRWLLVGLLALAALLASSAALFLRQQQQLVQAQDEFVSAVSHELRTPLTQIRMFSETLLLDRAKSPEQAKRWIGVINRESERLGHLVESILQFARSERRGLPLTRDVTDVAQLARDVILGFLPVAAARQVTIRTRLPAAALAFVDAGALRQMLLNLLDNAVKYGPIGQTITLELGSGARQTLEFRVDDQGAGVPAAERPRIWEPFERLHPGDGTVGGSGLGLSVVRTLAERMGGTAYVTDAAGGRGARFVIALPVGLTASDAESVEATRVTQEFAAADAFAADRPLHADAWMHAEIEDIMWPPDVVPERPSGSFRVS